jgi:hypothetical protein
MKTFNIEVISKKPKKIDGLLSYWGRTTIGDFTERFVIPVEDWTLEEYLYQWKAGLERIKTNNSSCLVMTVENLNTPYPSIVQWALYKEYETIFIRQQLLITESVDEQNFPIKLTNFSAQTCYHFVNSRQTTTEDGKEISEWSCTINDIITCLET